jgi:rhomboid protease GluP
MERGDSPANPSLAPTPEQVLGWIAAAGRPWFPAHHAVASGVPREHLDLPLIELRNAELVRVVDWVRGLGQGYVLTADGEAAVSGKPPATEAVLPIAEPLELPDEVVAERPPIITPALAYANLLWYFIGLIVASRLGLSLRTFLLEGDRPSLVKLGAASATELLQGEWWRLATSIFVHGTIWHLLVNVASLVMIGAVAEHLWGRWRTFAIFLVAGFAGSCLAMAMRPFDLAGRPLLLVGASGAIWGLATSILAWILLNRHRLEPGVAADVLRRLGLGFALSIAVSLLPGISWEAHLGGAIAGFVAAMLIHQMAVNGWRQRFAILMFALMPAASMGGLLLAIRHAPRWAPARLTTPPPRPDAKPHLYAIRPEAMKFAVTSAMTILLTTPEKRNPKRVRDVREEIALLWSNAVEAAKRLEQPIGDAALDERRAQERAFANARLQALDKLLLMIDSGEIPSVEAWKEWRRMNEDANRLWGELEMSPTP